MTLEGKFAALEWRAYLRAARADHTRNLNRPWYICESAEDNTLGARWKRQAKRYAEWYVAEVLRIDGRVYAVDRVCMKDGAFVAANVLVGERFETIRLPSHIAPGK